MHDSCVDRRRTSLVAGDYHDVVLPSRLGRIVVADVLRLETPDGARRLLARLAAQLAPGGQLVVVDPAAAMDAGRLTAAREWLESAGLQVGGPRHLQAPPAVTAVLLGRRPA